jgi:hypothetical protein
MPLCRTPVQWLHFGKVLPVPSPLQVPAVLPMTHTHTWYEEVTLRPHQTKRTLECRLQSHLVQHLYITSMETKVQGWELFTQSNTGLLFSNPSLFSKPH